MGDEVLDLGGDVNRSHAMEAGEGMAPQAVEPVELGPSAEISAQEVADRYRQLLLLLLRNPKRLNHGGNKDSE
jgi:hypothetical protein